MQNEAENPFSMEKAYKVYQENIRRSETLVSEITKGARDGMSERELLDMAIEAIAVMTGDTIFRDVVTRSLDGRAVNTEEESK